MRLALRLPLRNARRDRATSGEGGWRVSTVSLLLSTVLFFTVVSRLFTETIPILPSIVNFADLPLLGVLVLVVAWRQTTRMGGIFWHAGLLPPIGLFVAISLVSLLRSWVATNVALVPGLVFILLHLEGVLYALFFVNLGWTERHTRLLAALLVGLGILQLVLAVGQVPWALSTNNPDLASGSFGTNGSQMCFFLSLVLGYCLGQYLVTRRVRWLLLLPPLLLLYYAQGYKAMWLGLPLSIAVVLFLFIPVRTNVKVTILALIGGIGVVMVATVGIAASIGTIGFVQGLLQSDILQLGKVQIWVAVAELVRGDPFVLLWGVGPGSFTSRAFQYFANVFPSPVPTWFPDYVVAPITRQYVMPLFQLDRQVLLGSGNLDSPWNSYTSLLVETGLFGLIAFLAIYVVAFGRVNQTLRNAWRRQDGVAFSLAFAWLVGLVYLLQMAALDNWFENSRVTIVLWLLAVPALAPRRTSAPNDKNQAGSA